jgi:hypothetical protein
LACRQSLRRAAGFGAGLDDADAHARRGWCLLRGFRDGEGVEFGEHGVVVGGADPLEYVVCLPQQGCGVRGLAGADGAAAQVGQCVGLVPGAGDGAGEFQGLLVALLCLGEVGGSENRTPGPARPPAASARSVRT